MNDIMRRLNHLEMDMKNKIDCDVFDNELASLRELIGNIEGDDKIKTKIVQNVSSRPAASSALN
jgi:hypothetical protein